MKIRLLALAISILALVIRSEAQILISKEISDRSEPVDLVYKIKGNDTLKLVLRYPADFDSSKSYPAIVFFYGGGWNGGKMTQFIPQAEYLATRGMITVIVDYRVKNRHGTTPFDAVNDAKSSIRFLRANAAILNIDTNKIVASGGSAGGHLAASTGNLPGLDEAGEDLRISSQANALVLFNPVVDTGPEGFCHERMGERYLDISPIHHVKKGSPPTIIFHGIDDQVVSIANVRAYQKKMNASGNRCELFEYEGQGHGFFNNYSNDGSYYVKTVFEMDLFLGSLNYIKGDPEI